MENDFSFISGERNTTEGECIFLVNSMIGILRAKGFCREVPVLVVSNA